jgi:hypothetical protein
MVPYIKQIAFRLLKVKVDVSTTLQDLTSNVLILVDGMSLTG